MKIYLAILLVTVGPLFAQSAQIPEAAPVSCTSGVSAQLCQQASLELSLLQMFPLIGQVEFVIADADSFTKERDRLRVRHENEVRNAADSKIEVGRFVKLANRQPSANSIFNDSVIFVLNEKRAISRVVVSTDAFRAIDVKKNIGVQKDNTGRVVPPGYDPQLIAVWGKFIVGYLEGWRWGQLDMLNNFQ
jgi:hypothetical protein